jgi:hypothetical protein
MKIPARLLAARTRLADRSKWPRTWWWPLPEEIHLSDEDWKKQHDEISKAINKLLLILIGFCFFCGLALGAPDRSLLASDAKIELPFADTEISFVSFLIIGPVVLIAFSFYLHIFAGYWIILSRQRPSPSPANTETPYPELPFIFNLRYRTANWLSSFLFYWLVPVTLGVFAWKALPRPEAPTLIALTSAFIVVFLFLQMRRRFDQARKISTIMLWLMFLCGIFVTILTRDNPALCPLKMNRPLPSTSRLILLPFWPVPSPPLHSTVATNGTATASAREPTQVRGGNALFPAREKAFDNKLVFHSCHLTESPEIAN